MKNRLTSLSDFLNNRITTLCDSKEFSKYRSFYGECFAIASLDLKDMLSEECKNYLIELYRQQDKEDSEFHFEFNNYAMTTSRLREEFKSDFFPLKFKGTPCTNWTLLRNRVLLDNSDSGLSEILNKIEKYQLASGLILDDIGVKSFQYHCFSMAMIAESYELTKNEELLRSFRLGVNFIRNFISPTGETLFVGRGQNQSFGYSTLLYILVLAQDLCNMSLVQEIELVLSLLEKQVSLYNDLPLMLNQPLVKPYLVDMNDPKFYGWYPYNNYIDYFCFSSYFITKASLCYQEHSGTEENQSQQYSDDSFKVLKKKYFSVMSCVGGYWTNDLPIPFIQYENENITPLYGGEQFQHSCYNLNDVPLPINNLFDISIRKRARSKFVDNFLIVKSPLGSLRREYIFNESSIVINSDHFLPFLFSTPYFFFRGAEVVSSRVIRYKNVEFHFSKDITSQGKAITVSGELSRFMVRGNHRLEIKFL
ncbi:hypothetical protein [Halobacteriovorax sp. HLS]|uniref:hypothetical protein n=1 Tax=Halobacteriovorax sp. HLS TaxID=2234000 RepID=UPI000FDA149F|nr:hypothetical protein [Halobacteriovorax sp. HLS]